MLNVKTEGEALSSMIGALTLAWRGGGLGGAWEQKVDHMNWHHLQVKNLGHRRPY